MYVLCLQSLSRERLYFVLFDFVKRWLQFWCSSPRTTTHASTPEMKRTTHASTPEMKRSSRENTRVESGKRKIDCCFEDAGMLPAMDGDTRVSLKDRASRLRRLHLSGLHWAGGQEGGSIPHAPYPQTLRGSCSAVSKPMFASKYSLESS